MKLLALLLAAVCALPLFPTAPPAGQGDAAAAVAGAALGNGPDQPQGGSYAGTLVFSLTGAGKLLHVEGGAVAGQKPFKSTVKDDDLLACVGGTGAGCDANSLDINPAGGLFLLYDGLSSWRLANNPDGDDAVTLNGLVDGKGGFMMSGTHNSADGDTHIFLSGKVTFEKGTLLPLGVKGKLTSVSTVEEHYGSGNFKAVPAVL
ncbi:MAG: hypothetical protein FJ296_03805 [Planctomycetes bacterium]|nr:hypothetical protein [Planctomycetota bacterium]